MRRILAAYFCPLERTPHVRNFNTVLLPAYFCSFLHNAFVIVPHRHHHGEGTPAQRVMPKTPPGTSSARHARPTAIHGSIYNGMDNKPFMRPDKILHCSRFHCRVLPARRGSLATAQRCQTKADARSRRRWSWGEQVYPSRSRMRSQVWHVFSSEMIGNMWWGVLCFFFMFLLSTHSLCLRIIAGVDKYTYTHRRVN